MSAHHGNTPAAWTAVSLVMLGFVLGGLGLVIESMPLFWVGVALAPIGGLLGLLLSRLGYGADAPTH
ncbi:MAG: HGxxPAAW family protein [Nocardioidaceae bacterium]